MKIPTQIGKKSFVITTITDPDTLEAWAVADHVAANYPEEMRGEWAFSHELCRPKHIVAANAALAARADIGKILSSLPNDAYMLARDAELLYQTMRDDRGSWSFTASTGETLSITRENIDLLPTTVLHAAANKINPTRMPTAEEMIARRDFLASSGTS